MHGALLRTWWVPIMRGLVAGIFGCLGLLFPNAMPMGILAVAAVFMVVDGSIHGIHALVSIEERTYFWLALGEAGISKFLGIVILVQLLFNQSNSFELLAIWSIVTGSIQLVSAYYLHRQLRAGTIFALAAALSVIVGLLLLIPTFNTVFMSSYVLGLCALFYSGAFIAFGLHLQAHFGSYYPFYRR